MSGGEVFLYYDELKDLIELAFQNGGYTTLVTNGFWATSVDVAVEKLRPLVSSGLSFVSVSADKFHDPYVPFDRVVNTIKAAQAVGLRNSIRVVGSATSSAADIMSRLREAGVFYVDVMEMPLIREGRAALIPPSEFLVGSELPRGVCPSATLTINPAGDAMVCCNGGGSNASLTVGSIHSRTLEELEMRFASDPVLDFLNRYGPLNAVAKDEEMFAEIVAEGPFVSECELCTIAFRGERGRKLRSILEREFLNRHSTAIDGIRVLAAAAVESGKGQSFNVVNS